MKAKKRMNIDKIHEFAGVKANFPYKCNHLLSNLISLGYSYIQSNFLTLPDQRQAEKNSATRIVNEYMNFKERGVNNTSYETFVSYIARISFEIGRFWIN